MVQTQKAPQEPPAVLHPLPAPEAYLNGPTREVGKLKDWTEAGMAMHGLYDVDMSV